MVPDKLGQTGKNFRHVDAFRRTKQTMRWIWGRALSAQRRRGAKIAAARGLLREQLPDVTECLELQGVTAGIEQEHGRLFADLAFKANAGFNDERGFA